MPVAVTMELNKEGRSKEENKQKKKLKKEHGKKEKLETKLSSNSEQAENGLNGEGSEKKSKKSKHKEEDSETQKKGSTDLNEAMEVESSNGKKQKQKKEKINKQPTEKEESIEVVSASNSTENEKKESKKKEKKEKKRKREESEKQQLIKDADDGKKKKKIQGLEQKVKSDQVSERGSGLGSVAFKKVFYKEHPDMKNFSEEAVEKFKAEHTITVTGSDLKPIRAFNESGFPSEMLVSCKTFSKPTPIQSQCWPLILSGHDVVGIAETGSGKTIAYTLPALVHIKDQKPVGKKEGPIALVLSPTRELAMQIAEVCTQSGASCGIRSTCIYGGVDKAPQKKALDEGCHIVVATPGRLLDLVNQGICRLDRVTYLVMDEADRMLDLGFERDIREIVGKIRSDRQTLMFSATWPQAIQSLAKDYLINPVKVTIGSEDLAANHKVKQIVEVIDGNARDVRIDQLLREYHKSRNNRILIFVLYKKEASRVERMLQNKGWKVQALHGDVSQAERTRAMSEFKDGSQPLLVATDVAARGLDIPNVEYVINYSFPLTIEDYIHRIGRTGRGGKTGVSHTLFTAFDKSKGGELVQVLREANQEVPETLLKFGITTKKKEHKLYGNAFKEQKEGQPMPEKQHIKFDD